MILSRKKKETMVLQAELSERQRVLRRRRPRRSKKSRRRHEGTRRAVDDWDPLGYGRRTARTNLYEAGRVYSGGLPSLGKRGRHA
jgi:hypothetical protein